MNEGFSEGMAMVFRTHVLNLFLQLLHLVLSLLHDIISISCVLTLNALSLNSCVDQVLLKVIVASVDGGEFDLIMLLLMRWWSSEKARLGKEHYGNQTNNDDQKNSSDCELSTYSISNVRSVVWISGYSKFEDLINHKVDD